MTRNLLQTTTKLLDILYVNIIPGLCLNSLWGTIDMLQVQPVRILRAMNSIHELQHHLPSYGYSSTETI